jgi:hypothetical protein
MIEMHRCIYYRAIYDAFDYGLIGRMASANRRSNLSDTPCSPSALMAGRYFLQGCSAATYDFAKRRIEISCAGA